MDKQNGPTNPTNQGEPNLKDQSMVEKDSNLELLNLMNNNDNSQVIAQPSVVSKLKAQNQHLEQELQNLRYQLKDTIEKKKASRKMTASTSNAYSSNFRSDGSPEGERISELKQELVAVHKEMDNYKKEIKALQLRFSNIPVEKYEEAGNKFSEKQVELKCLELERKTLEKTLKEKNKLLKELQEISERANSHREPSSMPVEEELKALKLKVKEAQKKEQTLEKEAQKSNQHVLKLLEELGKFKEDYRRLLTKTGYDPVEDRIKPPMKIAVSPTKSQVHTARPHLNIVLKTREDSDIQSPRMEVNEKNFNKLKEEYREHKKTEAQKQRTSKLKVGKLKETLVEIDREKDEMLAKVADKEKEAGILRNRTRELYRALLSHGLLPPGKDYESLFRERQGFTSPQDKKKMNQNRSLSVGLRKINRETRENRESREVKKVQIKQIQNIRKSDLSNSSIALPKYTPGKETPVRDTLAQESIKSPGKETGTPIREAPERESPVKGGKEPVVKEYYLENYPIQQKSEVMPTLVTKGMVLKGYRVDDVGHRVEKESTDFNDQEKVGENIVRICHVTVWYDNDGIAGLQAGYHVYQNKEHQVIEGDEHVIGKDKYKVIDMVLQNGDYLKSVSGYTNAEENVIECLNLYSENGEAVTVGKNKNTSKMFKFDINDLEFPAIFHGSIRSVKKGKGSVLCRLGVLIKVDAVEEDIEKVENNPNNVAGKKRNLPKTNLTLQSPK